MSAASINLGKGAEPCEHVKVPPTMFFSCPRRAARCNTICADHVHHRHAGDSRKEKADSVPAPPTPPKQRRMVGPLRPSPRGQLAPGDAVEVRQLARGCRGSWRLAAVKQVLVRVDVSVHIVQRGYAA